MNLFHGIIQEGLRLQVWGLVVIWKLVSNVSEEPATSVFMVQETLFDSKEVYSLIENIMCYI